MFKIRRNLALLFGINVIVAFQMGIVNPLFPLFIKDLGASVLEMGIVLFLGGLTATMFMLPSGVLADRYNRRKLFIISNLIGATAILLYTTIENWVQVIPWAILANVSSALFLPSRMTLIADSTESKSMATAYGFMNIAWPVGFIFGPFIGGFIAGNYGWRFVFYTASLISFASTLLMLFLEDPGEKEKRREKEASLEPFLNRQILLVLGIFVLIHFFGNTARGILSSMIPIYLDTGFHRTTEEIGLFFSIAFGVATFTSQIPGGILADKYGRKEVMLSSMLALPLISALWPFLGNYLLFLLVYTVISALWSATWPSAAAYLMSLTPTSRKGFSIAFRQTAVRLGFTVGPLLGSYLWEMFTPLVALCSTSLFFAAALILTSFLKS